MSKNQLTRRDALWASAVFAPLAAASRAFSKGTAERQGRVVVGVATSGFRQHTNSQLAQELAKHHVHTVQLFLTQADSNYWTYSGRSRLSELDADRCRQIADAYRSAGVSIHSIGVYANLIHPDEAERKANLDFFEAMMKVGGHMGVRAFITARPSAKSA